MRIVSALLRLGTLVLMMGWFSYNRLYPVLEWLWCRLGLLWRCVTRVFRPIVGYAFTAIGWWQEHGGRDEPRIGEEVAQVSGTGFLEEVKESEEREGQPEAAAEERPGVSNRERPGCEEGEKEVEEEEEDEDEFDSESYRVDSTDELYCDYDSTWEDEERQENTFSRRTRRPAASRYHKYSRFETAAKDMQNYRHDYPYQTNWAKPGSHDKPNLEFYIGVAPSMPDGVYIDNFHKDWSGEYDALEYVHTYIQWLFPLQEPGVNYEASTLTKEEIKDFVTNSTAKENLLKSYKLMLDFYGIVLCNEKTGEVQRASNWRERFHNLNSHTHNSLRITRILKCQGTLGYPHYQAPLVRFFLEETLIHRELPNIKDSVLNYFVFAVLDKRQRRSLLKFAYMYYDRKDEFVWCPKKIQMMWSRSIGAKAKEMEWST